MSAQQPKKVDKSSPKVRFVEIQPDQAGQRIDNFLLCQLKGVPKSMVYRILRKGEVRVNKGRIRPEYRLKAGDMVRIPPVRVAEPQDPAKVPLKMLQQIESRILYEDKRVLVLNKPSGVAVHGGSGLRFGVIEILRQLRPDCQQLELVHRLDRDTSGCLIVAKKRSALRTLQQLQRENRVQKRYLALLDGRWRKDKQQVKVPLKKNTLKETSNYNGISQQAQ